MCDGTEEVFAGRLGGNVGDAIGMRVAAELAEILKPLVEKGVEIGEQFRVNGIEGGITKAAGTAIGGWWLCIPTKPAGPEPSTP